MEKIKLLIIAILLLTGCSLKDQAAITEKTNTYNNEEFNVSFQYPSDWELNESGKNKHAVMLVTEPKKDIYFDYRYESIDGYESENDELIAEGKISVKKTALANYPAKEYGMEGAIKYIIEKNGRYMFISTENGLTQDQKAGMEEILNSLSFE